MSRSHRMHRFTGTTCRPSTSGRSHQALRTFLHLSSVICGSQREPRSRPYTAISILTLGSSGQLEDPGVCSRCARISRIGMPVHERPEVASPLSSILPVSTFTSRMPPPPQDQRRRPQPLSAKLDIVDRPRRAPSAADLFWAFGLSFYSFSCYASFSFTRKPSCI
jgi:hypothetical protein